MNLNNMSSSQSDDDFINSFNASNADFNLFKRDGIAGIISLKNKDWLPFSIDFTSNDIQRRQKQLGLNSEIARAVGIKSNHKPYVLDTTAGLCRDSVIFASLGCSVLALERNNIIYWLLKNAIERAKNNLEMAKILDRIELKNIDAIDFLTKTDKIFDVIYIDPMFPKSKKSRLVKKDMQLFREIVGDDMDGELLLDKALKHKAKRVVVKRMLKSPFIGSLKPNFQVNGTITRFDIYIKS